MSALVLIPAKIRRLIPMLGSGADHEALAAACAIGRILNKGGLGFIDLAAAIPAAAAGMDQEELSRSEDSFSCRRENPGSSPRSPISPFGVYSWRRAYAPKQEREHRARVQFCQNRSWRLTPWECSLVDSIARLHGNLTIRRGDRLAVIVDRIEREARHAC